MNKNLAAKLETLPARPGVYVFKDSAGRVIYVGKAKELSKRARSYFQKGASGDRKGEALREKIVDLEVNVCETEVDALILEATLIKRFKPRFNVVLRDDKSYPYIAIYQNEKFPRVMLTRGRHVRGVKYYGPYVDARAARDTVQFLKKVFPLRRCTGARPGQKRSAPCLYYDMGMCLAPCRGDVEPDVYMRHVNQLCDFLEGKHDSVLRDLDARMRAAALEQKYEQAAIIKKQIESARLVLRRHRSRSSSPRDYDVIGISSDGLEACFSVARNRGGFHLGNLVFFSDIADARAPEELVCEFVKRYYDREDSAPRLVVVPAVPSDADGLLDWLSMRRGARVEIRAPARGAKKSELHLAESNAMIALEGAKMSRARDKGKIDAALSELAKDLSLKQFPLRIECFDISTFAGAASVASMVVFQDGYPLRKDYRKFAIKFTPGVDDVGMMREVLYRRLDRYQKELLREPEENGPQRASWARKPDLVILDGGKGQLNAGLDIIKLLGIEGVEIIALAKRLEEVYLPGRKLPVILPRDSEALFLLQRIRDEAHRVAVSYNRLLMERATSSSWLDNVSGVGPARKKALIKHFGSPLRVAEATLDELKEVAGVPDKIAQSIHAAAKK